MNINILLPYKEQFDSLNSGAVSILVKDQIKYSKYKDNIKVFGIGHSKLKNFISLPKSKYLRNFSYVRNFANLINDKQSLIEIHNRPQYFNYLHKKLKDNKYVLYFHNNPLELNGSKSIDERKYILKNNKIVIFLSEWIKNKFFTDIDPNSYFNFKVIYPGSSKLKKLPNKKNIIFFSGKLNSAKGYDLFCEATKIFLKKNPSWKIIAAGSESRRKIPVYKHVHELGQIKHSEVLNYIKKSKITVAPSMWDEPLGRLPIESASMGSVCVSSSCGGLIESNKYGFIIKNIDINKIYKALIKLSNHKTYQKYQKQAFNNFPIFSIDKIREIDLIRSSLIEQNYSSNKTLKILHISNFNDNANGRLFYSTQRKINNGFAKIKCDILPFDEKLFLRNNLSFFKKKELNKKILQLVFNYSPDLIILGHIDTIEESTFIEIKKYNSKIKIIRIYIDSISKEFIKQNNKILLNNINHIDQVFITSKPNKFLNKYNNKFSFIPNMTDKNIDTLKNFNNESYEYDLFFALSHGQNRGKFKIGVTDERDLFLKKLYNKTCFLKKYFISTDFNTPLWGNNYYRILSKCQMALNLSRGHYQDFYSSDRIASLFGNGLLVFLEKKTKFDKFFSKNEAVFFKNIDELVKKLKYFKNNKAKSRLIAKNGYNKYRKYFSSDVVCSYILKKINLIKTKKKFIWENI